MQDSEASKHRQNARDDALRERKSQTEGRTPQSPSEPAEVASPTKALLSSIFRAAPVGIGLVSNRVLMEVNDRMCEMVGYSPEELVGRSARMLYPTDEDYEYVGQEKYQQIQQHGTGTVETKLRCKNGDIIDVLVSSTPLNLHDLSEGVTFTALDITERRKNEEALRRSEEKHRETAQLLETLLDAIPDVIGVQDNQHRVLRYNAAGYDFLNMSYGDIQGKQCYELIGRTRPCSTCASSIAYKTKKPARVEKYIEEMDLWLDVRAYPILDDAGKIVNVIEHLRDITDQKRADKALRESEARYRAVVEDQTEFIHRFDPDGRVTFVNDALCRFFGHSRDELLGKDFAAWMTPQDYRTLWTALRTLTPAHPVEIHKNRGRLPNGQEFWGRWANRAIFDDAGQIVEYQAVGRDVTDQKQTEDTLRQSELRFRELAEMLPQTVFETEADGTVTFANHMASEAFGYTTEELTGLKVVQLFAPEDRDRIQQNVRRRLVDEVVDNREYRALRKDGSTFPVRIYASPILQDGDAVGLRGIAVDITDQKQAEEEHQAHLWSLESMERTNKVIRKATDPEQMLSDVMETVYSIFESDRVWLLFPCDPDAPSFRVPVEHCRPEYPGANALDLEIPMAPSQAQDMRDALASEDPQVCTAGTETPVAEDTAAQFGVQAQMFTAVYPKVGQPWLFGMHQCSYARAWTANERELFKEIGHRIADGLSSLLSLRELKNSETRFRELAELLPQTVFEMDAAGRFTYANHLASETFGYSPDEIKGLHAADLIAPEDRERIARNFQMKLRDESFWDHEYTALRKDGTTFPILAYSAPIIKDGRTVGLRSVVVDFTERQYAEQALQESKAKLESILESSPNAIAVTDLEAQIVDCNQAALEMHGFAEKDELLGRRAFDLVAESDRMRAREDFEKTLTLGLVRDLKYVLLGKHSAEFPCEISLSVMKDPLGQPIGLVAALADITERREAERALQESEAKFRSLVEASSDWIWEIDTQGHYTYTSPKVKDLLGYEREQIINKKPTDFMPPAEVDRVTEFLKDLLESPRAFAGFVNRNVHRDGTEIILETNGVPIFDAAGEFLGYRGIDRDITERKRAEYAVRESERRYRELYEGSRDASVAVTLEGRILDCNSAFVEMIGYAKEKLYQMHYRDITPPQWHEAEEEILREQVLARGYSDVYEKEYRRKDGTIFPIELRAYLNRDRDGRPTGVWAFVRDITDRKRAEQALRESERTLTTLMGNLPGMAYRCKNTPNWTMEFISEGCLNLTGYQPNELTGDQTLSYGSLIRSDERAYVWEQIQRSLKMKKRFELEYRIRTRNGEKKWVWERGIGIYTDSGDVAALEGFISDIAERKQAEEKLLAYQKKLKSLASELALAEERERRRIAADLHDHACQSLALSKMKLQSLLQTAGPADTPMLQSICETLTETIEGVRELTFDLSSPTLYRFGLEAALEELLKDKLGTEHDIKYRFSDDGEPKPLAHDVLVLLYQSIRELLINAIKHSQAHEVTLDIGRQRDSIIIVLADDGVGFDVDEVLSFPSQRHSVGLFNTLERLDYIGGKLDMDSRRGQGSRFTLIAPLEAKTPVAKENGNDSEDSTR